MRTSYTSLEVALKQVVLVDDLISDKWLVQSDAFLSFDAVLVSFVLKRTLLQLDDLSERDVNCSLKDQSIEDQSHHVRLHVDAKGHQKGALVVNQRHKCTEYGHVDRVDHEHLLDVLFLDVPNFMGQDGQDFVIVTGMVLEDCLWYLYDFDCSICVRV